MPNWCVNELRITGPPAARAAFKDRATKYVDPDNEAEYAKLDPTEAAVTRMADALAETDRKTVLSFTAFNPIPVENKEDWYNWNIANWGTKWDASDPALNTTATSLVYDFDTAWSPPCPAVIAMSKMFPELKFSLRYWEGGMGFQGKFVAKAGEILTDISMEYKGGKGG